MSAFNIDCELDYDVLEQTLFLFNIGAPSDARQRVIAESVTTEPALRWDEITEAGTTNRLFRVDAPPGPFSVRYMATVEVNAPEPDRSAPEIPIAQLPGDALPFLHASRYCESDSLFSLAVRKFGEAPRGYARVEAICAWIRENIDYLVGTSSLTYSARDVLAHRAGVCRDFAHLAITFCRALNIPARFVTGYARYSDPPPDFHAIFEAFLGDRWYPFDPTELSPTRDLVRIGSGRDASEAPFATFFGAARLRRLSPLVELAPANDALDTLVPLQTPNAGILLAA